jgi:hypothetical protein
MLPTPYAAASGRPDRAHSWFGGYGGVRHARTHAAVGRDAADHMEH